MKNLRLYSLLLGLFALSSLAVNAAQLASAKVLSVEGSISYSSEGKPTSQLTVGTILTEGDSITTSAASRADLVFSNGSELTIQENTNITLAELSQETFAGTKSYEQLKADPSKSQALLELNYGKVYGHVKKLRKGSKFHIETPLGTAAIRGTKFEVSLAYDADKGEFILGVLNLDGLVDLSSKYAGKVSYGQSRTGDKNYDAEVTDDKTEPVPPTHQVVIRISEDDPAYAAIIDAVKNFPPTDGLEISVEDEGDDEGEGEGDDEGTDGEGTEGEGTEGEGTEGEGTEGEGTEGEGTEGEGTDGEGTDGEGTDGEGTGGEGTGGTGGDTTTFTPDNTPNTDEAVTVVSPNGGAAN